MSAPTPLTVIGGFLGAGKTTFLNHLLASGLGRVAVLVNDFGAVDVDASLIVAHDGTTMTLANGCVCCSLGAGFLETLGAVLDAGAAFSRIVVEASGVGDPARIAEIARVEPALRPGGIVVLAEAPRIAALLDDARVGETARRQLLQADVALLTKRDLCDLDALAGAHEALGSLRPDLRVVCARDGRYPSLDALGLDRAPRFRADLAAPDHEDVFRRWLYRREGVFDPHLLEESLAALPPALLRLKGRCAIRGSAPALLQMAGGRWTLSEAERRDGGVLLVGIGTVDLPADRALDAILDRALCG